MLKKGKILMASLLFMICVLLLLMALIVRSLFLVEMRLLSIVVIRDFIVRIIWYLSMLWVIIFMSVKASMAEGMIVDYSLNWIPVLFLSLLVRYSLLMEDLLGKGLLSYLI